MRSLGLLEAGHTLSSHRFRDRLQREFQRLSGEPYAAPILSISMPWADSPASDEGSLAEALRDGLRRLHDAGVDGFALACPGWYRHFDEIGRAGALPLLDPIDGILGELALRQIAPPAIIGILRTCATTTNRLTGRGYRVLERAVVIAPESDPQSIRQMLLERTDELSSEGAVAIASMVEDFKSDGDARYDRILDVMQLHAEVCARWILQDAFCAIR